jgi:UDP-glucose 4-epimerase
VEDWKKKTKEQSILVTGGPGFMGIHTVDLLIEKRYEAIILDNLEPQVHQVSN